MRRASPSPFDLLCALAADASVPNRRVLVRQMVFGPEFEKAALSPATPHRERLAGVVACALAISRSDLPDSVRSDAGVELDRLAFRILWAEGLMSESLVKLPPLAVATRLLDLAAEGLLPSGPVGRAVLERVKALIALPASVDMLVKHKALRTQLLTRLAEAELRVRELAPGVGAYGA